MVLNDTPFTAQVPIGADGLVVATVFKLRNVRLYNLVLLLRQAGANMAAFTRCLFTLTFSPETGPASM